MRKGRRFLAAMTSAVMLVSNVGSIGLEHMVYASEWTEEVVQDETALVPQVQESLWEETAPQEDYDTPVITEEELTFSVEEEIPETEVVSQEETGAEASYVEESVLEELPSDEEETAEEDLPSEDMTEDEETTDEEETEEKEEEQEEIPELTLSLRIVDENNEEIDAAYQALPCPSFERVLDLTFSPYGEEVQKVKQVEGTNRFYSITYDYLYAEINGERATALVRNLLSAEEEGNDFEEEPEARPEIPVYSYLNEGGQRSFSRRIQRLSFIIMVPRYAPVIHTRMAWFV